MRFITVISAILGSYSAFASFDLVLVSDSTKNVVHRYDGVSGAYLGSFGAGRLLAPSGMALDQANNTVIVGSTWGMTAFNYNTGEMLWTNSLVTSASDFAITPAGTLLKAGTNNTVGFFAVTSPATATNANLFAYQAPSSTGWAGVAVDGAGKYFAYDTQTGKLNRWNPANLAAPELVAGAASGLTVTSGIAARGSLVLGLSGNGRMVSFNSTTLSSTASGTAVSGAAWTDAIDCAFGHGEYAYGLGMTAGGAVLQNYARSISNGNLYNSLGQTSLSQVTAPSGLAIILAPEPASIVGFGLGLTVLIRRRSSN